MNLPDPHPPFERLVDLVEGRLPPFEADTERLHLANRTACAVTLTTIQRMIALLRRDAASQSREEPPAHVVQRAMRLLRQQRVDTQQPDRSIREWLAELVFDSATRQVASGVRAFGSTGRQLVFSAGVYQLDLRLFPMTDAGASDPLHTLRGQLLGPCPGLGQVALIGSASTGSFRADAALNAQCEFEVAHVPPGTYALTVRLADAHIEVGDLDLRALS